MEVTTIAYFSMEMGLHPSMPSYSGGLGILAGDSLKAAADLFIPSVGVTLLHRKGYFDQHLDEKGNQSETPVTWYPEEFLEPQKPLITVDIEDRQVRLRAWRYVIHGGSGHDVPVYFLDTTLPENTPWDQTLTDYLYGGDSHYRLCQEAILGFGGLSLLRAMGYRNIQVYHMNEGHSALLTLALLQERMQERGHRFLGQEDIDAVRARCVFTTHTPVPAGHDKFPMEMVRQVIGAQRADLLLCSRGCLDDALNMTYLSLYFSRYVNGVSHRHEEISQTRFPNYPINSITNGVHAPTWVSPPMRRLYDQFIPEWRTDNLYFRYAISIPLENILAAHAEAKQMLLDQVWQRSGKKWDPNVMTIGFARRATAYKRADLLFYDEERLKRIAAQTGHLQLLWAGKAHPRDDNGKAVIRKIFEAAERLKEWVKIVYLEQYDMSLAKHLCAGVDLWLNTPQKPQEASGTSGMKAALNGVPSFSVLDGWWIEGHVEGVTGWSIGDSWELESNPAKEAGSIYQKLENQILPMFYRSKAAYASVMRASIAINGSFFNAQRMMLQYLQNAYLPPKAIFQRSGTYGINGILSTPLLPHAKLRSPDGS